MKRYRVLHSDYDYRANLLKFVVTDQWDPTAKAVQEGNVGKIVAGLRAQYGIIDFAQKLKNFCDLGARPDSVLAYHNRFMIQIRDAFTIGAYYSALTGACALGERVLNHLLLALRDDYRSTAEYKNVYRKEQFDDWWSAITILESWTVLRTEVAELYRRLAKMRNTALHFNANTDQNDRSMALEAVTLMSTIVDKQFGGFGPHPWFIPSDTGIAFLKKEAEGQPFIRRVYLPSCALVGPRHTLLSKEDGSWTAQDENAYEDREVTDEEFVTLFKNAQTPLT